MSHTVVNRAWGTTAELNAYTGPAREIVVNTDDFSVRVQDGTTAGGHPIAISGSLAVEQATPANPTGTTSATSVMMGLAGSITTTKTGRVHMQISGTILNATAIGDGAAAALAFGTGTAPVNGAALSGTVVGGTIQYIASTTAGEVPFAVQGIAVGLTIGTAYWVDLALKVITGGTAVVKNISLTAFEL